MEALSSNDRMIRSEIHSGCTLTRENAAASKVVEKAPTDDDHALSERVALRKEELLTQKRQEMARIIEEHDDLVREAFHLEKFVTLVSFDPVVAKSDSSPVFEAFRSKYDLVSNNLSGPSTGGSSSRRTTRRAVNDRRQSLSSVVPQFPANETLHPGSRDKGKRRVSTSPAKPHVSTSKKAKLELAPPSSDMPPPRVRRSGRQSLPTIQATSLEVKDELSNGETPALLPLSKPVRRSRRKTLPAFQNVQVNGNRPHHDSPKAASPERVQLSAPRAVPDSPRSSRKKKADEPPAAPPPPFKRIKLIHRVPPPTWTHPEQIPPAPQFSKQLGPLLQSYVQLEDDGPELSLKELQEMAEIDGDYRYRISVLRSGGRLSSPKGPVPRNPEPERPKGHWDGVVESAVEASKIVKESGRTQVNGARRVARIITAHWEKVAGADDKQRKAEEKRMQALVKSTLKLVLSQWKDAVKFVRQRKVEEAKAEQARLGKQHLDAIIEHSTQALQAQRSFEHRRSLSQMSGSVDHDSDTPSERDNDDGDDDGNSDDESQEEASDDDGAASLSGYRDSPRPDEDDQLATSAVRTDTDSVNDSMSNTPRSDIISLPTPILRNSIERGRSLAMQTLDTPNTERVQLNSQRRVSFAPHNEPCSNTPQASPQGWQIVADVRSTTTPEPTQAAVIPDTPLANVELPTRDSRSISPSASAAAHSDPERLSEGEVDSTDADFEDDVGNEDYDRQLEVNMEAEESDSDDGELNALEDEAELPLDELLRQYGYVPADGGTAEDSDDEENEQNGADEDVKKEEFVSDESVRAVGSPIQEADDENSRLTPVTNGLHVNGVTLHPASSSIPKGSAPTSPDEPMTTTDHKQATAGDTPTPSTPRPSAEPSEAHQKSSDTESGDESGAKVTPSLAELIKSSDEESGVKPPFLLRGTLRPYQQAGLEWLVSLYLNNHNGILADEMGLGKTIQTISLLAYLACEKGNWGPHLIIVPTSVLKNWEMEFKKFLPGFKILAYYGNSRERKERRHGWKAPHAFNVCITSYQLILADQHIFRRMPWVYMILDEAHNIKNFKSQRWQDLFTFRPVRRLLLTGTPLQNNLMELWALMHFLNPVETVGYRSDFSDWFSKPVDRAIEDGRTMDVETQERVNKLHTLLRPYLLRRMKADVEKELPGKFEHLVYCRLSKRQRFLYDEFMARAETKETLASGNFLSVVNCLMQLRKVCNHPDLFEVRPIVTSYAMQRSAIADFEIKELLVRRRLLASSPFDDIHPVFTNITSHENSSLVAYRSRRYLDASSRLSNIHSLPGEPPPPDYRTVAGFQRHQEYMRVERERAHWQHFARINRARCSARPIYSSEKLAAFGSLYKPLLPFSTAAQLSQRNHLDRNDNVLQLVKSYGERANSIQPLVDRFGFATAPVVARDLPVLALKEVEEPLREISLDASFDTLHPAAVKLQIAFPDASLLQYDCGKLQELDALLKERRAGGHRVLIFTQMTKVLDILEIFLNFHGYRYLRLDGSTKIEDRQKITQRFNMDTRVLAFISSSRSGGVGINLTGADTVIFYDSDYNPSMDRQCEDRAHRIGQIRDVHIYRFISKHTVEESMLRKANQKRSLDDIVIRQGEFDWRKVMISDLQMEQALEQVEDVEDAQAARNAAAEMYMDTAGERQEFDETVAAADRSSGGTTPLAGDTPNAAGDDDDEEEDELEALGLNKVEQYMVRFVEGDWSFFSEWRAK